jgi:hypothetical protein
MSAELKLGRLDELVRLSGIQKSAALDLFRQENQLLDAMSPQIRTDKGGEVRQAIRERLRAVLTPEQRKVYDRAPQTRGGGLTLPAPEMKVARLDAVVHLTVEQKSGARRIYEEELDGLLDLSAAERVEKGAPIRRAAIEKVQALLTSEQLAKQDAGKAAIQAQVTEERKFVNAVLRSSPAVVTRLGPVVAVDLQVLSVTESDNHFRQGKHACNVTGERRTEVLSVSWDQATPESPLRLVGIEDADGTAL